MIKLVTLAAGGRVRMKLRLAGTMNRRERRTSNIDDATLYLILEQANHAEDVI